MLLHRRPLLKAMLGTGLAGILSQRGARGAGGLPMPAPLRQGSRVRALAPGTWWEEPQREAQLLQQRFAASGWRLSIPEAAMGRWRWFSAPDRERLRQWQLACSDPGIAAVVSVAGGWGSARLLERGWRPPPRPIWLVGFSDASALLLAQLAAGQGGGIHGSSSSDLPAWQRIVRLLRGEPVSPLQGVGWRPGKAVGELVVTNLTVATHLIGTPWFPDLRGRLLVLEDVGEAPYRIDRMLTHWRTSGVLRGVAGIGLGRFSWKEDDVLPGDLTMEEVLIERLGDLGVPLVGRLPVGHGRPNLALPLGRQARLDGGQGNLDLI